MRKLVKPMKEPSNVALVNLGCSLLPCIYWKISKFERKSSASSVINSRT